MATVTRENIGTLHDKIIVQLAKEDYFPSFEKSLKQHAKTANIPGFRKGMVPTTLLRKMYGQSVVTEEVVRAASQNLEDYLKNEKISIFAQPLALRNEAPLQIDVNNPSDVTFSFEIGLKPDFEITPLKNKQHIIRYKIVAAEKMIEDEVDRIKRRYGKVEPLETIQDKENILYTAYEPSDAEGNVVESAQKSENTQVLDRMPAKLKEMLMGKKTGDTLVFRPADVCTEEELQGFLKDTFKENLSAPDNYYKLTITKIGTLIPKELDEELYKDVFPNLEVKDPADFKEKIRQELSKDFERITNDRLHSEIYELLVHNSDIHLPVPFLKRWLKENAETPKTDSEVEHEFGSFEHQLRWQLISDKLISDIGLDASDEEIGKDIKERLLANLGMLSADDAPWLNSYVEKTLKDEKIVEETHRRLIIQKLFKYLETQFDVEDKEIEEEAFFKLPDAHATHHHHH